MGSLHKKIRDSIAYLPKSRGSSKAKQTSYLVDATTMPWISRVGSHLVVLEACGSTAI